MIEAMVEQTNAHETKFKIFALQDYLKNTNNITKQ